MKRPQYRTLTALFRETTFRDIWGHKLPIGVRPSITHEWYIARKNNGNFPKTLSNADFAQHFAGHRTLYFFGNGTINAEFSLVMIDIDVQKSKGIGTTEGAWAFANHLKSNWPSLYCEPSTNGKGVHGYLLIRKCQVGAEAINESLNRLAAYLEHQAIGHDIEMVEVKGHCPVVSYKNGLIKEVKSGTFAKYPRKASLNDLLNTVIIDWQELRTSKFDVPKMKKVKCKSGSTRKELTQEYIDQLPKLKEFWASFAPALTAYGNRHVTNEDGGVFLCITKFLTENPFKDNRLSVRTIMAFWQNLHHNGHTSRSPNHHIIKAIRDHMSSRGLVKWVDHRYQPPSKDDAKDGVCCRWALMGDVVDMIDAFLLNNKDQNVDKLYTSNGYYLIPQMKMLREQKAAAYYSKAEDQIEEFFRQAA